MIIFSEEVPKRGRIHRSTGIPVPVPEENFCSGSGEHFWPEFEHLIWYQIWWIYSYNINFTEHKLNWINQNTTFVGKFLMKKTILFLHSQN